MSRKQNKLIVLIINFMLLFVSNCGCLQRETIYKSSPSNRKLLHLPYTSLLEHVSSYNHRFKSTEAIPLKGPVAEDYFQIDPSDATDVFKYSQPAVDYYVENPYPASVPSISNFKNRHLSIPTHGPSYSKSQKQTLPSDRFLISTRIYDNSNYGDTSKWKIFPKQKNPSEKVRSTQIYNYMDSSSGTLESNSNIQHDKLNVSGLPLKTLLQDKNVTNSLAQLLPVSSHNVLSYENSPSLMVKDGYKYAVPVKKSSERAIEDKSSHSDYSKSIYIDSDVSTLSSTIPDLTTLPPFFSTSHLDDIMNQTVSLDNSETTYIPSSYDVENISSSSIGFPSDNKLSQGTVAGIVIGVLVCATILSSAVIYLLYQKYNGKCTSVVEGKFNSDNCGYLDDSLRSSIYLNNHIELPKESSEEMSSLDNDSFLNSLETMTIQNYWADNSKNTKV